MRPSIGGPFPGKTQLMKRLIAVLALSIVSGLAACSDPFANDAAVTDEPLEVPLAPVAEDAGVPAADPGAAEALPADSTTTPAEKLSSEESVQPESETLFY
jgi:hypothetical protein